ncbi:MAG: hypothetical protein M1834_006889 [Cirrosporium novae-zelandiae]|nr:MAG: hypothetical protein M1834_006889 [Cirrosporium novae-zelandiae]
MLDNRIIEAICAIHLYASEMEWTAENDQKLMHAYFANVYDLEGINWENIAETFGDKGQAPNIYYRVGDIKVQMVTANAKSSPTKSFPLLGAPVKGGRNGMSYTSDPRPNLQGRELVPTRINRPDLNRVPGPSPSYPQGRGWAPTDGNDFVPQNQEFAPPPPPSLPFSPTHVYIHHNAPQNQLGIMRDSYAPPTTIHPESQPRFHLPRAAKRQTGRGLPAQPTPAEPMPPKFIPYPVYHHNVTTLDSPLGQESSPSPTATSEVPRISIDTETDNTPESDDNPGKKKNLKRRLER